MKTDKYYQTRHGFFSGPFARFAGKQCRQMFILGCLGLACARAAEPAFLLAEATIDDLQARMAAGALTARELTAAYLQRIADVD